ncbi:MAG: nitrate reductase [Robiginitomaculum sp.]|nr:MAG: nitrate reductase [Robiginitomaculum sp.]
MVQVLDSHDVKTTCAYCGVGCGIIARVENDEIVSVRGDEDHPANFGRLCAKGMSLHETMGQKHRILHPQIDGKRASWDTAIKKIADKFRTVIEEHGPESVAFYVSGQCLTEDYYVANKLMKGYVGAANIDTNSRLCMASSVVGHKRAFGSDTVPGCYEDLELADVIILVGSNMAWCHPVLYQRILAAKKTRPNMKIIVVDPRETASCDMADLHIPLTSGSDIALFQGLFNALDTDGVRDLDFVNVHTNGYSEAAKASVSFDIKRVSRETGVDANTLKSFYDLVKASPKTVTVYSQGVNQAVDGTDKVNAIINTHLLTGRIGKPGSGPFSITGQPNAMGGREVGGLANQLASHFDLAQSKDRDIVQNYWNAPTMAQSSGYMAVELFDAIHRGDVKAVWIMATNPVVSMPDADHVREALEKCELVVVSDLYDNTDTVKCADIILPATGWGEKDGTITNSERCISRQRAVISALGESRHDWQAMCDVAIQMGWADAFAFENPAEIFEEYAGLCALDNNGSRDLDLSGLCGIGQDGYDTLAPVQWPIDKMGKSQARLFADGLFFTADRKAKFVIAQKSEKRESEQYPFTLNTGRIRDQWHTMTRTGRAVRLSQHITEPFIDIHPDDARAADIYEDEITAVQSVHGQILVRARLTKRQAKGSVFVPMHWTDAHTANGRVDKLVTPNVDPFSGQPAFKSTLVNVTRFKTVWYGFAIFAEGITPHLNAPYWTRSVVDGGEQVELAGIEIPNDWADYAGDMCGNPDNTEVLVYKEEREGVFRTAYFKDDKLVFTLFIAPEPISLSRTWTVEQLKNTHSGMSRYTLLAGRAGDDVPDKGAIICACLGVGVNQILEAIQTGASTVDAVGECTGAGTNCGSCRSDISHLLQQNTHVEANQ